MGMESGDFLVIGAGIAGASAAYELAASGRVIVLEREAQPGYHTTGRSAALFTENYGNAVIRKLTIASRAFLEDPPDGFADNALLSARGLLLIANHDQRDSVRRAMDEAAAVGGPAQQLDGPAIYQLVPVLRVDYVVGGVYDPSARDMDVHGIQNGFLKGLRARGGTLVTDAEVRGLTRRDGRWVAETPAGAFAAPVVVNAAGAWCDVIAGLAGVPPVGLAPKRRTAITFDPPAGLEIDAWPQVIDIDEEFYFKPDAGRIMASPADETPSPPCDAQPEELDIAITIDRIERATTFEVRRVAHSWAGLRSFVADKTLVAGFDDQTEGFFWLAGQGGYGIMTSPAMSRATAGLITSGSLPTDLAEHGLTEADLSPGRLR
jgi:D-arginine dehydrogenase